jgi:anti-sigma factor RsiW
VRYQDMRLGFVRDHLWTRRHLHAYLDGELDRHARSRVEGHARWCPKCRRLLAMLTRTLAGLHALGDHPPPGGRDGLAESVIKRLRDVG